MLGTPRSRTQQFNKMAVIETTINNIVDIKAPPATNAAAPNLPKKKKKSNSALSAIIPQLLAFLPTVNDHLLLLVGMLFAILNGLVYPTLAYLFSNSFSNLGTISQSLDPMQDICLKFVGIRFAAFFFIMVQNFCFLIASI
ncbi:hypothetical protein ACHAW6_001539 [Cyclotella cf. meneghiniana]